MNTRSAHFLPTVLALLVGRGGNRGARVVPPVTRARGDTPLKRSNRLVLLIGIFLAIVAFVLIVLMLGNEDGGGGVYAHRRAGDRPVVVAAKDIALGATSSRPTVCTKEIPVDQKPADSYSDTSLVIGQIARQGDERPAHHQRRPRRGGAPSRTSRCPRASSGSAVQVDQVDGVGTLIKAGDFVDMVVGFTPPARPLVVPVVASGPDTVRLPQGRGRALQPHDRQGPSRASRCRHAAASPPPAENTGNTEMARRPRRRTAPRPRSTASSRW